MTRTRYRICETTQPHFLTCTVVGWTPVFTRDRTMWQKLEYIHNNPVERGYVDEPTQWRYSSARNYAGRQGLLAVTTDW